MASTDVEHTSVDTGWVREPLASPSARFGWHDFGRKTGIAGGWFAVIGLLAMTIGNHEGHVEDVFLVGIALGLAFLLIRTMVNPARSKAA
ncbi:DUF2631 domain-containing protein [Gordonia sp. (in: high G+C Gram-positive bacteria)]|uniref:DUF2631 domain-containing protein n=1 Tax=Gordonia sp. (in: high G+C Gram-positive bacteria) TaxID=84139 RepID=UPI0039E26FD0